MSELEPLALLVVSGPAAGAYFRIPREGAVLGRGDEATVKIADPGLSRAHARLVPNGRGFVIEDLHSRYGIYIEGEKTQHQPLRDGERVQLSAETVLRIRYQDELLGPVLGPILDRHDPLTGLYDRRYFLERLEPEYTYARRHRQPLSVLMADVDWLGRIDERHGKEAVDDLLRQIARILAQTVRAEDFLARYGHDEFALYSRSLAAPAATVFAERLLNVFRAKELVLAAEPVRASLSIGVATYDPNDSVSMMTLLTRAEAALFDAKRQGRDRVVAWA